MFRRFEGLLIFLVSLIWFAALTPWGFFTDPDAFYHAHIARLILEHGPLMQFPWLDLTTVGQHFVDHHLLFHLVLVAAVAATDLFTKNPLGELWAAQGMAMILAAMTSMVFWKIAQRLDRHHAWLWTLLLLFVPGYSFRMVLAKASPLAVGLFIAGIGVIALSETTLNRRRIPALLLMGLIGMLFALSHGGWIILIAAVGMMIVGDMLLRRIGEGRSWNDVLNIPLWWKGVALIAGTTLGLLLHPNRNELFRFLWVQVVRIGLVTPKDVRPGMEWLPVSPREIISSLAVLVIAGLLAGLFLIYGAWKKDLGVKRTALHHLILLTLPLAITLPLTLKSGRFIEYLAPGVALWIAALWSLVEADDIPRFLREQARRLATSARLAVSFSIVGLVLALGWHQAHGTWAELRRPAARPFAAYRQTLQALHEQAKPGDRVFHSDWDEFPLLFAADDRLRYVSGLDPVFLYDADPALSEAVRDVTIGRATSSLWNVIVEQTDSSYVFVTTVRHPGFYQALESDPRFQKMAQDSETAVYQVVDSGR